MLNNPKPLTLNGHYIAQNIKERLGINKKISLSIKNDCSLKKNVHVIVHKKNNTIFIESSFENLTYLQR